ncbi:hypothetical protein PHMEG_00012277 [Phytophthora megakarya]|uniref:Uncharacterized protein n=1 Tax=Phytophthora megakarya TaxID=4795 RepID=A0A225W9K8_9STRA|nr:hypothetical protein PHMEG_00012277 [Phytophthora megakarya]
MPKNADICRVLFSSLPDHYFKSNYCGTIRRQLPSSGYGNLVSHLKDKHDSYVDDYLAHGSSQAGNRHAHGFVNDKISNIYRWRSWVVDRNMPLSEVDHPATRSMSHLMPILSKTLKKYLVGTAKLVEQRIASILPPTYLTRHSEIIDAVAALMAALRAPNNRRELRCHTDL